MRSWPRPPRASVGSLTLCGPRIVARLWAPLRPAKAGHPSSGVKRCPCFLVASLHHRGTMLPRRNRQEGTAGWFRSLASGCPNMSKPFADNRIKLGVFLGERRKMLGAMRKLGSTAPASRADWSAPQPSTQGAVERCCMELVERNGDAERAMRAGLGLIEAMPTLATTVGTPRHAQ